MARTPISKVRPLNSGEASDYLLDEHGLQRTSGTLANQRVTGEGPEFRKDRNRALYTPAALDVYAEKQLSPPVKSTAELREIMGDVAPPRTGAA